MGRDLTARQKQILEAIREHLEQEGRPPTVREIGERFGFASSTVFQHLGAIEKKGYIKRDSDGLSRSIEVVGMDPGEALRNMRKVPLLGRVAAGAPMLATENIEGHIYVDGGLVRGDDVFALRVRGDSMIDAGILEGDYVIVRRQNAADPGDIVVALLGEEATVKRLATRNRRVFLQPENDRYEPIPVDEDTLILGKAVCVMRLLEQP